MNFIGKTIVLLISAVWIFFFFAGCSIPQIIVLKDPLTAQEYLRLGVSYENRNQLELAEAQYQKAAVHDLPEAFLFLGNVAFQQKKYKDAEKFYRTAIKKMPGDPRAYNNLAWLYYEQGTDDLKKAEHLARKALELSSPDHHSAYLDTLEKILLAREEKKSTDSKD
jgi:tetratricopeptide (TPR) repeat protein